MNDSADITKASERLNSALSQLVQSLDPLLARVTQLETAVNDSQQFNEDRARLARELDTAQADLTHLTNREASIKQLANETREALDHTISEINDMIQSANGGG